MKNRLLSLLLICVLSIVPFISGCNMKDVSGKNTKEKVTNVFKTERISVSNDYIMSFDSVALGVDKVYVLGYHKVENPEVKNEMIRGSTVIISCDVNGKNVHIDEAPYEEIEKLGVLSDGSFVFLLNFYDPETFQNEYWLNKVDTLGNEVFSVNVSDMFINLPKAVRSMSGSIQIYNIIIDGEDRIYLQGGNVLFAVSADSGETMFNISVIRIDQVIRVGDKIAVKYADEMERFKYIDPDGQQMGDSVPVPENVPVERYTVYQSNDPGILYCYQTPTGLYGVSGEADGVAENREIVNWVNSDINPNQRGYIAVLDKDRKSVV